MTVADAVQQVLASAGAPLHYEEITQRILSLGLWVPLTKTPSATVRGTIYVELKKGTASRFQAAGKGVFALSQIAGSPAAAPLKAGELSFTDAAERVLEQCAGGRPMHYREVTRKALELELLSTQGQTPEATMRALIGVEIQRQEQRGERPRFFRLAKGLIGLTRWRREGDLPAQIERHNLEVRKKLHGRLMALAPADFEVLVSELLVKLGFQTTVTRSSGDGGIDVRGTLVVGDVIRTRMAIQVKRWKSNVQAPTVQQVRGSLGAHEQGLIITTSDFSSGARTEAARADATPVALMNGAELVKLLMENEIGVRRTRQELFELVEEEEA